MNSNNTIILGIIILFLMFCGFTILSLWGADRYERYECGRWQTEAKEYKENGYYLAGWQSAQCSHYGIDIDAPIYK